MRLSTWLSTDNGYGHDKDVVAANLRHGCRMFACHIHVSTCLSRKACVACINYNAGAIVFSIINDGTGGFL